MESKYLRKSDTDAAEGENNEVQPVALADHFEALYVAPVQAAETALEESPQGVTDVIEGMNVGGHD